MTLREDAAARFGVEWVNALEATAGCHSEMRVPLAGSEERLAFALLEAIDYNCPDYGWTCPERKAFFNVLRGVSVRDMQSLLRAHADAVLNMKIAPPSVIGMMAGAFDFLDT